MPVTFSAPPSQTDVIDTCHTQSGKLGSWRAEKQDRFHLIVESNGENRAGPAILLRNILSVQSDMPLDEVHKPHEGEEIPKDMEKILCNK